jgi:hypothetical protein
MEYAICLNVICRVFSKVESQYAHAINNGYRSSLFFDGEYGPSEVDLIKTTLQSDESAQILLRAIVSEKTAEKLAAGKVVELRNGPARIAECSVISIISSELIEKST